MTHRYKEGKFPVADQVIYHFGKILFDNIEGDFWVAGGAIARFLSGDKQSDIDLFTSSRDNAAKLICQLRSKYEFKPYYITPNAIKGTIKFFEKILKVDVVKNMFKSPQETIDNFDFTVTCFAVNRDTFYYHPTACFDLLRKKLVVNNLNHPVDSMRRLQKYNRRGFTACNGTIGEIAEAIHQLSPDDMEIVEFYPVD